MAGRKWKEVVENINSNEVFQISTRDQSSVREHFHKLLADFKVKMRKEETSSGTSPEILEEISEIMTNKPIEEGDRDVMTVRAYSVLCLYLCVWGEGELEVERLPFYTELQQRFQHGMTFVTKSYLKHLQFIILA